jgi:Xaa-Pro aminopeptidase
MKPFTRTIVPLLLVSAYAVGAAAQETARHQSDFPPEEFAARRAAIFDRIGGDALAIIQGAANVSAFDTGRAPPHQESS